jgi:AGZA family xanthine/uracil permease-like MFS transporter
MSRYQWARPGDVNAFFGLMLDNVAVMITLVSLIAYPGGFSPDFVLTRMIPGTALGVLLGDLVYTWMAFRVARSNGRSDVCAMPLGLDTPSTFGVAFLVLIPTLKFARVELNLDDYHAQLFAWHVGLIVLVFSGVFKILFAPLGNLLRRLVPRAGLLGSLAAIALALIAFLPMSGEGIATSPLVGMTALVVIFITLLAHRELPFKVPGALAAVLLGVVVYQVFSWIGAVSGVPFVKPMEPAQTGTWWDPTSLNTLYGQDWEGWRKVLVEALQKLPVMLPFALATIVGGIDCTESAAAAGDEYNTSHILWTEGIASLLAGLLGGVIQTTPYIGHPAYKKMGGRAAYTLATALFIGLIGVAGWFPLLYALLPKAAMFTILVFVGLEITAQTFEVTPKKHYPALALAMLPALAALIMIVVNKMSPNLVPGLPSFREELLTLRCLANGFIITSLLWAAALAMILDGRLRAAAVYFGIAGVLCFFGVIHSPLTSEQIGLPWDILPRLGDNLTKEGAEFMHTAVTYQTPYHWTGAYALVVLILLGLSLWPAKDAEPEKKVTPG